MEEVEAEAEVEVEAERVIFICTLRQAVLGNENIF